MSSGMRQDGFQNFEHNSEGESEQDGICEFSYEDSLDSIRARINDIWQDDPSKYDVLTPALCNICLTSELLQKRLSSETSADILAGIAVSAKTESPLTEIREAEFAKEDDFFDSDVFRLHQECTHVINTDYSDNIQQGDARAVGYGRSERQPCVSYNDPFDPRLTFAGLQDIVFPNAQFIRPDKEPQDNICLAVDDVGDIVREYLNKYHDCLDCMRSRSQCGEWVHMPEAVLPAKFASYELWIAAKNEAVVDNEADEDCRLLASKLTSHCVRRLWLDMPSYSPSTSDDQDVFSQQGSVSCGSSSPRDSSSVVNEDLTCSDPDQWSHYKQLLYYPVGAEPSVPTSELWAERNCDSIKDFVPRVSYGFNLPVPDVVKEESLAPEAGRDEPDEDLDSKTDRHTSRLFDIWCVPEQNDGQGDGSPNRSHEWSPRDVQPPDQHLSPETGLQIPLLVSTKRRERPVRGVRNARRSNYRDYQVTFVDDVQYSDPCRYSEPETVSSSRATISDTKVWTVKTNGEDGCPSSNKHGFSRSETHQEYRDAYVRENLCYPANQKIELSAHSEPFIPRWRVSDENNLTACESEKRLNKIEEELTDMRTSPQQRHENQNTLSPRSQMLKTPSPEQMKRSPVGHQELQLQLDDNDHQQQSLICNVQSDEFLNSPESQKSAESYQQWSPAHDSEESPIKEYELFDSKKSFYDNSLLDRVQPITGVTAGKSASKPCGLIGNMKFTGNGWKKIYDKGNAVDDLWNIWSNYSETKSDVQDQSWANGDAKLLKPLSTSSQSSVNDLQPTQTSVPTTVWQHASQGVWTKPEAPVQSQYSYVPQQSHLGPRSVKSILGFHSRTSKPQSSMPCDKPDQIPQARIIRPQTQHQLELKPSIDVYPRGALAEPHPRQYQTSPWTAAERNMVTNLHQSQENTRYIEPQGMGVVQPNQNISFVSNRMACVPTPHPYDYRNMVVLQPHQKQSEPRPTLQPAVLSHGFAPQPSLKPTTYHTFGPSLSSTLHRVPFDQHSRLHPSVISRPNAAFAPPAGFAPTLPTQTYRHVTVAANYNPPKLVAVPAFDARARPRYYTSFLNFNNHNEAYSSDSELSESSMDREDDQDVFDRHGRARPIRANPANLIHLT